MTFGAPPDPRYLAFKQGAQRANDDLTDAHRWRWAPGHGSWLTYSMTAWIMDDVGIPDTTPTFSLDFGDDSDLGSDLWMPELFRRIDASHQKYRSRWPDTTVSGRGGLVWTWRNGGDWRVAIPKVDGGGHDDDPQPPPTLPAECLKRVADVREYMRQGIITAAEGQRLIRTIVDECT